MPVCCTMNLNSWLQTIAGADFLGERPQDIPVRKSCHLLGMFGGPCAVCYLLFGPFSKGTERTH